jgi:hypothetical protein
VSFGGPDGLAAPRTIQFPIGAKPERVILTDVNGDRKADAIAISGEGHAVIVLLAK